MLLEADAVLDAEDDEGGFAGSELAGREGAGVETAGREDGLAAAPRFESFSAGGFVLSTVESVIASPFVEISASNFSEASVTDAEFPGIRCVSSGINGFCALHPASPKIRIRQRSTGAVFPLILLHLDSNDTDKSEKVQRKSVRTEKIIRKVT